MRINGVSTATALAFAVGLLSNAGATVVPAQKGGTCLGTWDTATAEAMAGAKSKKPWTLNCGDGDPSCDADGTQNGMCVIGLSACVLQEGCQPEPLTKFKIAKGGAKKFVGLGIPANLANGSCGAPGTAALPLKGKKKNKPSKPITLKMTFKSASGGGKNVLKVRCVPGSIGVCPEREASGLPKQLTLTVPAGGTDLDTGWTGASHNFPVVVNSQLKFCLSNCDGQSDTTCDASGDTGANSLNGETFGAPLPLLSANTPVCVINEFQAGPVTGTFDLASGEAQAQVNLLSKVYLRSGLSDEVCPRCVVAGGNGDIGSTGRCSATATNSGAPCRVNGKGFVSAGSTSILQQYALSSDCRPTGDLVGSLDIKLPLTTGESRSPAQNKYCPGQTQDNGCSGQCNAECTGAACVTKDSQNRCIDDKGGISQLCCASDTTKPCYPTGNTPPEAIVRQGVPFDFSNSEQAGVLATNFCIASAGGIVSAVAGLPGPGAMLLPGLPEVINTQ
jgi:hypothetical protein